MVSVIVCTRNRAPSLGRALQSLAAMEIAPGVAWELIVVDNGSKDATREVVEEFAWATGLNVRYAFEAAQGISHARNRGLREARGEIIAFTDDDVQVDRSWLREILAEFTTDPDLALLAGRTLMLSPEKPELSTRKSLSRTYHAFPCHPRQIGTGNNMALRASLPARVGTFDVALGAGSLAGSGEDTDFNYRAVRSGQKVLYSPLPLVYHDHNRASPDAHRRSRLNYMRGWGAFLCKQALRGDRWIARLLLSEMKRLIVVVFNNPQERKLTLLRLGSMLQGVLLRVGIEIQQRLATLRNGRRGPRAGVRGGHGGQ
ncbi:MAG: glycosyltransferase [bacterium]|nr:glycosyltransferase [bacterium]